MSEITFRRSTILSERMLLFSPLLVIVAQAIRRILTDFSFPYSCAMGEVVDDRLKVKGVQGLRVVDASVFPGHVSGNIMATTYAVAEKGADIIKEDDGRYLAKVDSRRT